MKKIDHLLYHNEYVSEYLLLQQWFPTTVEEK